LLATVAGIIPASPGFSTVVIKPHLGALTYCESSMLHPNGTIQVLNKKGDAGKWQTAIELLQGITGKFIWQGKTLLPKGGKNNFVL